MARFPRSGISSTIGFPDIRAVEPLLQHEGRDQQHGRMQAIFFSGLICSSPVREAGMAVKYSTYSGPLDGISLSGFMGSSTIPDSGWRLSLVSSDLMDGVF
ncbi:hypothetical protein D0861_07762 [Hortaea werneckii]|uniref:Uncharacterized protein n=1 Tax=Hortaea werneckii TaxID=91943 RepID=A0A3M7F1D9_HORWE|nr:hypothetical protein D0861_07762 [Hortaea werneckii]